MTVLQSLRHSRAAVCLALLTSLLCLPSALAQPLSSLLPSSMGTNRFTVPTGVPAGYVPDDKYKLRAGDKVSLQIVEDREPARSLTVADSGELDVPYLGRIAAEGRTCKELAGELKTLLEKEYYHRASVVLSLDVANKYLGRVYVWGQVRNQGAIEVAVNEKITAGKAILRAGGFSDFANKKKVRIVRGGNGDPAQKSTFEINMVEVLEEGKTENDVPLMPDDFVVVPSRLVNF